MENTSHDIYIDLPTRPNGTVVDGPLEFTGSDEVGTFAIVNGLFEFTPAPGHVGGAKFHLRHVPVVETRIVSTVAGVEELTFEEELELVRNADTDAEELGFLSLSQYAEIAYAVIDHPNTDNVTLAALANGIQHGSTSYGAYHYEGVSTAALEKAIERSKVADAAWDEAVDRFKAESE